MKNKTFGAFTTTVLMAVLCACAQSNLSGGGKKVAAGEGAKKPTPAVPEAPQTKPPSSGKNDAGKDDDDGPTLGNPAETVDESENEEKPEIDSEELKPVTVNLAVTRQPDTAAWTNCLFVQVNGGPEVNLGCNKGALAPTTPVQAKAMPFCNQVRLILYSNGNRNRSTESKEQIVRDFRIQKTGFGKFAIQCNDNADDDFNDLNVIVSSQGQADFTIENSGFPCN